MRNWRNNITAILNTRCSSYPYIIPALSTLHRTHPYIRRGTIEREKIRCEEESHIHVDMIVRPVIGSTTSLTIVISMKQRCPSRLKMRRCRTAVIPRKRISGAAAPHRFPGESVPHRCHAARVSQDMLPLRCHEARVSQDMLPLRCHAAAYLKTSAAVAPPPRW